MGYDPANQVTLVVWTNLTVSLDENADGQYPHAESARSDLCGVPASTSADLNADLDASLKSLRTLPARCAVWIAARTQGATTEKLSDFRHCWSDPAVSDEVRKTEARPAGRASGRKRFGTPST